MRGGCTAPDVVRLVSGARIFPRALLSARPPQQRQFERAAVTRKIQRYVQRHTRSVSVSFYVLSLHQHRCPLRHARRAVESGVAAT